MEVTPGSTVTERMESRKSNQGARLDELMEKSCMAPLPAMVSTWVSVSKLQVSASPQLPLWISSSAAAGSIYRQQRSRISRADKAPRRVIFIGQDPSVYEFCRYQAVGLDSSCIIPHFSTKCKGIWGVSFFLLFLQHRYNGFCTETGSGVWPFVSEDLTNCVFSGILYQNIVVRLGRECGIVALFR